MSGTASIVCYHVTQVQLKIAFARYKALCYSLIKSGESFADFQNESIFQVCEEGTDK